VNLRPSAVAVVGGRALLFGAACTSALAQEEKAKVEEIAVADEADDHPFTSAEDGWFDVSGFLDKKFGFLPIVLPITEPAVGFGAAVGLAFISSPLGAAKAGYGRPDITLVGGLGTENGSRGLFAGDIRFWLDDRLKTVAGAIDASINLDFHGLGDDSALEDDPLRYSLRPLGGTVQAQYRLGDSNAWAGLGYSFASMSVRFDAPAGTTGRPDFEKEEELAALTPTFSYDSRDNFFTPNEGAFYGLDVGLFGPALGGDDTFERISFNALHYTPIGPQLYLGLRANVAATFGDAPFYMNPYVTLRGVPVMRYQGEEVALLESEVRWQCWDRFSVIGFVGAGMTWNDFERLDDTQDVVAGGTGFRYELARAYGIHAGLDVAVSRDTTAVYLQIGSAWMRP
jgi:hypothetical protein